MKYKFILLYLFILLNSCTSYNSKKISTNYPILEKFNNSGFTLIFNNDLYKDKVITKKINERDLIIFQRNLKRGTAVKITNPFNEKTIIAKVGDNAVYPNFNNSVVSIRIANELEIDINEPYIILEEIRDNALFIAKKSKTFDEEKKVADKAPVDSISVNDLNEKIKKKIVIKKKNFSYIVKIADFYYKKTADEMVNRIKIELNLDMVGINKINENKFRVFLGPYNSLNTLQIAYNGIEKLGFENIEIINNE
ncbi:hypothetical protein IDH30_03290 [Pelagibacterales bacterium SAG-MED15]|nr:hypothetical protein [Pelagibacterales bacterium SAG-MED15]